MIKLFEAHQADIDKLLEIENQCFKESDRLTYHGFYYHIMRSNSPFLSIILNGKIVGYIGLKHLSNKITRIVGIAIDPAYHSQGYGSEVLKILEKKYSRSLKRFDLEVRQDNEKAIKFYKKNGYIQTGIKHNYYSDGTDALILRKNLKCLMQKKTGQN